MSKKRRAKNCDLQKEMEENIDLIQYNVRQYLELRKWNWFQLLSKVHPLLTVDPEDVTRGMKEELKRVTEKNEMLTIQLKESVSNLIMLCFT